MVKRTNESMIYNVSLTHPKNPSADPISQAAWKNPLVSLDQAMRATIGPDEVIIGDPSDFKFDVKTGYGSHFDWGWDLETGVDLFNSPGK